MSRLISRVVRLLGVAVVAPVALACYVSYQTEGSSAESPDRGAGEDAVTPADDFASADIVPDDRTPGETDAPGERADTVTDAGGTDGMVADTREAEAGGDIENEAEDAGVDAPSDVEELTEDAAGEGGDDGDAPPCPWRGQYVEDPAGACWLERDGTRVEEVPSECCYYRLCQPGCGPCYTTEECAALSPYGWWTVEAYFWCRCRTPGPPSPETDRLECHSEVAMADRVWFAVEPPCEINRAEYDALAASWCAEVAGCGPISSFSYHFMLVYLDAGACPWHMAEAFKRLDSVVDDRGGAWDAGMDGAPFAPCE